MKTYTLELCGLRRELPVIEVAPGLKIASFVILGDTELVCRVAPEIVKRLPEIDAIVTPEAKGIPLAFEISRLLGMNYIIARKNIWPYMDHPVIDEFYSKKKKRLFCLSGDDARTLRGKRVAIVDDVISSGETIEAIRRLIEKAGGTVAAAAAILVEGDAEGLEDIIYLKELPVFRE
ncbi:phosphoribosyltransferase family protein [Syntrophaceticus schinkii]|jgi:adenine phosphoribosyltransferase|uniref:Adenine phosphoribosyltransferase n=1 Tax=Syntrophaceticus schinkii TaxID=499207 RepID=A0A0B7MPR9_9FIRM|nr:phosphoribosyltransferase family protein [Syntrophaceticus schinkii]MDD4262664.1 phosphoribosyltransferase family protein [Syntrophaceticus schinkii]MDD4674169.1 phosphoribosyltransferase family protein [Syntrophaceticus schinkii]CEO89697.1 Adenine phosphoribosyltransferase [Syntrophaceticus schinkii]